MEKHNTVYTMKEKRKFSPWTMSNILGRQSEVNIMVKIGVGESSELLLFCMFLALKYIYSSRTYCWVDFPSQINP